MSFQCTDCSFSGRRSGSGGQCPACGSFNLVRSKVSVEKKPPGKLRLVLLVALWAYLIAHILWKLSH